MEAEQVTTGEQAATSRLEEVLDQTAAISPSAPALLDQAGSWTFAELRDLSLRAASWLIEQGLTAGDRLVVQTTASRECVALLYGALRLGVIFVPVNADIRWYSLSQIVDDCEPALMIVAQNYPSQGRVLRLEDAWAQIAGQPDAPSRGRDSHPEEIAVLLYTSGSTAAPKAVVCPHRAMLFASEAIDAVLGYRSDDVVFSRLSLAWDPGLYKVLLCVRKGCQLVLAGAESDLRLVRRMSEVGATIVPVVPSLASTLVALSERDPSIRPPVRLFSNTGAFLPPSTIERLRALFPGAVVARQYGQTECKRITIMPLGQENTRMDSVGLPLPGTTVEIVDAEGRSLPAGRSGEIVVSGPHLMNGYWRAPYLTARTFRRDSTSGRLRLHTGDYGRCDAQGYLYFEGRRDELFKRQGLRISTTEIEAAALTIKGVRAAVAVPPTDDSDLALAIEGEVEPDLVLRELARRLENAKVPSRCIVLDRLPVTANGKYARGAVVELLAGRAISR